MSIDWCPLPLQWTHTSQHTQTHTHTEFETIDYWLFGIIFHDTCAKLCKHCNIVLDVCMFLRLSVPSVVLIRGMLSFCRHVWCLFWRTHLCPCNLSLGCFQNCLGQLRCFAKAVFPGNVLPRLAILFQGYVIYVVTSTLGCSWSWGPRSLTIHTITNHFEHTMMSDADRVPKFLSFCLTLDPPKNPKRFEEECR